jgi:iron(III) transport system substrate-binding protein
MEEVYDTRTTRRTLLRMLGLGTTIAVLAACEQAPAPSGGSASSTPAVQSSAPMSTDALYEAARKEGRLVVNAQEARDIEPAKIAFKKRFAGIDVAPVFGRGADIQEKITADQAAGANVIDVLDAGTGILRAVQDLGFIVPYQSPELARVRSELQDNEQVANADRVNIYGITVNTKLVPEAEVPTSWKDLLDPKWKGQIAMQDPRGSGGGMIVLTALLKTPDLGEAYVRDLGKQSVFIGRQNAEVLTGVVRGEHRLMITSTNEQTLAQIKTGAPLRFVKPREGVAVTAILLGVVKNAPHPNAARLWIDWKLSDDGQSVAAAAGYAPARSGVPPVYPESSLDGAGLLPLADTRQDLSKRSAYTEMWQKFFLG